jgi:hypothetical protein
MFVSFYFNVVSLQEAAIRNKPSAASSAAVVSRLSGRLLHVATKPEGHRKRGAQTAGAHLPVLTIITIR